MNKPIISGTLSINGEEVIKQLEELNEKLDIVIQKAEKILTTYEPLIKVGAIQVDFDLDKVVERIANSLKGEIKQM